MYIPNKQLKYVVFHINMLTYFDFAYKMKLNIKISHNQDGIRKLKVSIDDIITCQTKKSYIAAVYTSNSCKGKLVFKTLKIP